MINSDEINFVIHSISFNWKALIDYYWSIVHEGRKVPVWGFEKQIGWVKAEEDNCLRDDKRFTSMVHTTSSSYLQF